MRYCFEQNDQVIMMLHLVAVQTTMLVSWRYCLLFTLFISAAIRLCCVVIFYYLRQGGYVFAGVCLSVCALAR